MKGPLKMAFDKAVIERHVSEWNPNHVTLVLRCSIALVEAAAAALLSLRPDPDRASDAPALVLKADLAAQMMDPLAAVLDPETTFARLTERKPLPLELGDLDWSGSQAIQEGEVPIWTKYIIDRFRNVGGVQLIYEVRRRASVRGTAVHPPPFCYSVRSHWHGLARCQQPNATITPHHSCSSCLAISAKA